MLNKTFHAHKTICDIGYYIMFNDTHITYKLGPYYERNPLDPFNCGMEITPVIAIDLYKNLRIASTAYPCRLNRLVIYDPK